MPRRRVVALDVLNEVRRAMRVLRRVEKYLLQEERHQRRTQQREAERAELRELAEEARRQRDQENRHA